VAGLSNSEYKKQQEEKVTLGKLFRSLLKLVFFIVLAFVAPLIVLTVWTVIAIGVMVWTVIAPSLTQKYD